MNRSFLSILVISMALIACNSEKRKADLIVYNAKVYNVNDSMNIAESFAVLNGKFVAVGTTKKILEEFESQTKIDLHGKAVFPGFIDGHCHFWGYGLNLRYAALNSTDSFEEVLKILQNHNKLYNPEWIVGRGWDQNRWPVKEFPDNKLLSKMFPNKPVVLTRIDGHAVLVNQKAIEISGAEPKKFAASEVIKKNGELTGVFLENAADFFKNAIPEPSLHEKVRALLLAQKNCFSVGLTSVTDAGISEDWIQLIDSLQKTRELKMRIYAMLSDSKENINRMYKGYYKTDYLSIRSIKLYADGALGSRGALLKDSYSDDKKNKGIMAKDASHYRKVCKLAYELGYQVNTHCIGDSANALILKIYSEVLRERNDFRWRIEHAQVVDPMDMYLFKEFSIIPSVQPTHATSDMYWAEKRLGSERIKNAYSYNKLLQQNSWICLGTDFPIEDINPLFTFYAAITRKDQKGWPLDGFQKQNALTRTEALKGITIWPAKAGFEEKEKGSIEPGKFADFVVLEKDIMTCPEAELFKIKVLQTFSAGEKVFDLFDK